MDFFTADCHFGHANIINYCNRPFADVDTMNETMRRNWNQTVSIDDTVYCVGDFSYKWSMQNVAETIDGLHGNKIFIIGNHDKPSVTEALDYLGIEYHIILDLQIKDDELGYQPITLCHYPMLSWNQSHRGAWNLFGHHHGSTTDILHGLSYRHLDVGVDKHNFTPISFDQVKTIITKQYMGTK